MKLNNLNIEQARQGLARKKFSSVELTRACLDSIKKQDKDINAFITITEDLACQAAEKADKKIQAGETLGSLEGIPLGIKDNILVQGVKATAASKILSSYVATYDATVVKALKEAGAVIVGKTNLDEFALGSSGETSYFGPTKNPWDLTRVPGGTSSGSAAAVASDEVIYALGSDTGGSVRQPAAFCGVVGFKPTYGRVSRSGLMAMASSFDQIGSITKTVKDAAYVFEAIAGQDKLDATTVKQDSRILSTLDQDIRGLKMGVPNEYGLKDLDKNIQAVLDKALKKLTKMGVQIQEVSLPYADYALAVYYILMPAEVSANLARYDGVRYGLRVPAGNLLETYLKSRAQGLGREAQRRIILGTYVLSAGYHDAYYQKAQKVRRLIKEDFEKVFKTVDCLILPTTPTTAFGLGEKMDDPLTMYLSDIFTVSANVAGLPAISLPAGKVKGLPVGVQLMGDYFSEGKLLRVAHHLEQKL